MNRKKIIALVLAAATIFSSVEAYANPITEDQRNSIVEKQNTISDREKAIEAQRKELEEKKKALEESNKTVEQHQKDIAANQRRIDELETEIQKLNNDISVSLVKLEKLNEQIEVVSVELEAAIEEYNIIVAANEARLRELYKNGYKSSVLSLLLQSEGVKDFFDNIVISSKIVAFDNSLLDAVNKAKKAIEDKQLELEALKDEVLGELATLEDKKSQVKLVQADFQKAKEQAEYAKAQAELLQDAAYRSMSETEKELAAQERAKKNAENEIINTERSFFSALKTTAENTGSKSTLESTIESLRSVRKQLTTKTADDEIVAVIEKAKRRLANWVEAPASGGSSGGNSAPQTGSAKIDSIIALAYSMIGTPYVWGGESWEEGGFDCSGFMQYIYKQNGIRISRTTYTQIRDGIEVAYKDLRPGDLVFPHDGHVGMYVGNGEYIHAPRTGETIRVQKIPKFWRARRIIY